MSETRILHIFMVILGALSFVGVLNIGGTPIVNYLVLIAIFVIVFLRLVHKRNTLYFKVDKIYSLLFISSILTLCSAMCFTETTNGSGVHVSVLYIIP